MKKCARSAIVLVALALGFALVAAVSHGQQDGAGLRWLAGEFPEELVRSMDESSAAFLRKDLEATRSHMTEDFATWELHHEDGPRLLVKGREESIAAMQSFFDGGIGSLWQEADVDRVGSIGGTMVQIEHDHYRFEDGPRTISTFVVIQYKDGKRWREWRLRLDPLQR